MSDPVANQSSTTPPKPLLLKRLRNFLKVALVPPVGYQVIQWLRRSMRLRVEGADLLDIGNITTAYQDVSSKLLEMLQLTDLF